jgi:hypothetical protein
MQLKLPRSTIIIWSTIKIRSTCMCLHVWTWSSVWTRFLCYHYELFTLFLWTIYVICVKNRTIIYGFRPTWGIRCLIGGLTRTRGDVWPVAWQQDTINRMRRVVGRGPEGGPAGAACNYWKLWAHNIPTYIYIVSYNEAEPSDPNNIID